MSILADDTPESEQLELGTFVADASAKAVANGNKFFQRHASILGSTGSGKSWLVARLLECASRLESPSIVVFDIHGEYAPLTVPDGSGHRIAERFRIAGPGDIEVTEPDAMFLPYWLLGREEMLSMFLDRSDQNAPNQASRFTLHVRDLKRKSLQESGDSETERTFTVDSPIPYALDELVALLDSDNRQKGIGAKGNPVKGEWEDKLTRFLSRLTAKIEDRRYGFMFKPPAEASRYDWLEGFVSGLLGGTEGGKPGIKIIDFSEVPTDILPVVAAVLARLLYNIQFWMCPDDRKSFSIVCDEAHLYLPKREDADSVEREALAVFERIAKEGRKYGVSLVVVSQRPADVSRTILSQCNNFVVLRLTNNADRSAVSSVVPNSLAAILESVPILDTGECLVLGDSVMLPARIRLTPPSVRPASATRMIWDEWRTKSLAPEALSNAVRTYRAQRRLPS